MRPDFVAVEIVTANHSRDVVEPNVLTIRNRRWCGGIGKRAPVQFQPRPFSVTCHKILPLLASRQ